MSKEKIAVFADIPDQRVQEITPEQVRGSLEAIAAKGHDTFSPDNVQSRVLIALMGDSEYSARMGVVKQVIAQALYSPEDFTQYLRDVASQTEQQAQADQTKYDSRAYKLTKALKLVPDRIQRALGSHGKYIDSYVNSDEVERKQVARNHAVSRAYQEMAEVVTALGQEFRNQSAEDVLKLSELDHFFSGKWNGSRLNLTFTNERIRDYGVKLQQLVQRVWNAGIGEDTPNPLTQEQLMPVRY
ncbi:hypothetical protein J4421_02385 [Candidatus Woesearchaeota archaeon]|nr:hypothetical protein [Candidatus Woesearchaeota archaeon]